MTAATKAPDTAVPGAAAPAAAVPGAAVPGAATAPTVAAGGTAPGWLLQPRRALAPCGCSGRRARGSFLGKTLAGAAEVLRQVMFTEEMAARPGLLQRLDPRAKIVSTVALLLAAALAHHVGTLAALYLGTLALAVASRVPFGFFVRRVWLFIPVFTGIVVLPAALSLVTPGEVVVPLWRWHGVPQGFTGPGLTAAALIVSRVAVSVSLVVLLTITTNWTKLLGSLRVLGVPRIFVLIIGMAYRYVFHLLISVEDMFLARRARTPGRPRHDARARAFVSASAGSLIGRAHQLSEEVHQAMTARGFRGDVKTLDEPRWRLADGLHLLAMLVVAALAVGGDRVLGH